MSYLLMWLEAPLQSWGADSRFGNRTTLPFPTRSGLSGLLCCAKGLRGEQREWLNHMNACPLTIRAFARQKNGQLSRQPMLQDFQMVGSGYNADDKWENLLVPKKSDGKKPAMTSGAKIVYRHYLQDMAFACVLKMPQDEAKDIGDALVMPVWELSLGRRNCPPSERIFQGVFDDEDAALTAAASLAKEKDRGEIFTVYEGSVDNGDEIWTLNDVPVCFGDRKIYRDRQVTLFFKNTA